MLPARMQMYTRACAALRRLNPCWTYIWNAWKRAVNQSGYGYLVDEAIRCTEERLHKNSLSLQEVSDYVFVFFIQSPRFRVFDQRRLGLDSVFILSNHGKNVKSSIVNLCISIRILTKKAAE